MFKDRKEAAEKLAQTLDKYKDQNPLVLGFPVAGMETAYYVAHHLQAELAMAVTQKLKLPSGSRNIYGAVAEDGSTFLSDGAKRTIKHNELKKTVDKSLVEINETIQNLRQGQSLPDMKGRTIIITTHGINTGATLFTIIDLCYNRNAGKVIVASPICSERMEKKLTKLVDEVVILNTPFFFHRVSQGYRNSPHLQEDTITLFLKRNEQFLGGEKDKENGKQPT